MKRGTLQIRKRVIFMEKQFDIQKYIMDRLQKFGEDFWKPEKKLSEMTLDELRSYVTMFNELGYTSFPVLL